MHPVQAEKIEARDYALIGKIHAKQNPESAHAYKQHYNNACSRAMDDDPFYLNRHFHNYCKIKGIQTGDYLGALRVSDKVDVRRLFIGCIIRIYQPQLLTHDLNLKTGMAHDMCVVLGYDKGNLSETIEQTLFWLKTNNEGFADQVEQMAKILINIKQGYGHGGLFAVKQETG